MKVRPNTTISKLDAARRQLETVVKMYFHDGDMVSIHTLVSAAYNIIRDINQKKGGPPMIVKDFFIDEAVKPEYRQQVRDKLNEAENFFKHADRDHAETLDFNPEQSELMIYDAIQKYLALTGDHSPLFKVFQFWYILNNQEVFKMSEEQKLLVLQSGPRMHRLGKTGFFDLVLQQLMRQGV
jgi:hypothetical protein